MLKGKIMAYAKRKPMILTLAIAMLGLVVSCNEDAAAPALPEINSFTPTEGVARDAVTIKGMNLSDATVSFNGISAAILSNTEDEIQVIVPTGATTGKITVETANGSSDSDSDFTIFQSPTIASFSPTEAKVGDNVTITGTNLANAKSVQFNGESATIVSNTDTEVVATVPVAADDGKISVTTAGGTATSASDLNLLSPPVITGFSVDSGAPGTEFLINGSNLSTATEAQIGNVPVIIVDQIDTQIKVIVGCDAVTGKVKVVDADGTTESDTEFTVTGTSAPTITSVPLSAGIILGGGFGGENPIDPTTVEYQDVNIKGTNLFCVTSATIGGETATIVSQEQTSIVVKVPANAPLGANIITLTNGAGSASSNNGEFYIYKSANGLIYNHITRTTTSLRASDYNGHSNRDDFGNAVTPPAEVDGPFLHHEGDFDPLPSSPLYSLHDMQLAAHNSSFGPDHFADVFGSAATEDIYCNFQIHLGPSTSLIPPGPDDDIVFGFRLWVGATGADAARQIFTKTHLEEYSDGPDANGWYSVSVPMSEFFFIGESPGATAASLSKLYRIQLEARGKEYLNAGVQASDRWSRSLDSWSLSVGAPVFFKKTSN